MTSMGSRCALSTFKAPIKFLASKRRRGAEDAPSWFLVRRSIARTAPRVFTRPVRTTFTGAVAGGISLPEAARPAACIEAAFASWTPAVFDPAG